MSNSVRGTVFNIQRYSLHDGPGIRTTVFLSGCSLRCDWCSNPESQRISGELMHNAGKCLRCGRCVDACLEAAICMTEAGPAVDRARCTLCGACAAACVPHAMRMSASEMTTAQVLAAVEADRPFYRRSGGGVTLSGGEPLLQPEFTVDILKSARRAGINTAVETAGLVPWASLEAAIPHIDYLLFDIKHVDDAKHAARTGVSNDRILDNLRKATGLARSLVVRVPVIPGFNDSDDDIAAIARHTLSLGLKELHLLPYHRLGQAKYRQMDRDYLCEAVEPLSKQREESLAALVRGLGLTCRIRG